MPAAEVQVTAAGRTIALLFFGLLPRFNDEAYSALASSSTHNEDCRLFDTGMQALERRVLPAVLEHVVKPSVEQAHTSEVHIYGHTWLPTRWSCGKRISHSLRELLGRGLAQSSNVRVRDILTSASTAPSDEKLALLLSNAPYLNVFRSIEQGLGLLPRRSEMPVLLIRWDVLFFSRVELRRLNWNLFYRANWCFIDTDAPPTTAPHQNTAGESCVRVSTTSRRNDCGGSGSPDFWFAANASSHRLMFSGALSELAAGSWNNTNACCCGHGYHAARQAVVTERHGLQLGRFLYEGLDYSFLRSPMWDPTYPPAGLWDISSDGVTPATATSTRGARNVSLWDGGSQGKYRYQLDQPRMQSSCEPGLYYCGCPRKSIHNGLGVERMPTQNRLADRTLMINGSKLGRKITLWDFNPELFALMHACRKRQS